MSKTVLEFTNIDLKFGKVQVLFDVNFKVNEGEIVGLIGESGSGKSTIARTIMKIYEQSKGEVKFEGKLIKEYSQKEYYSKIQMIYQDPFSSLNPTMKVRDLIAEPLHIHGEKNVDEKINAILESVGLSKLLLDRYPNQLSGGQCQRIGICRALLLDPQLMILDESIASLDVSVQGLILNLLKKLNKERLLTMLFISHDLSVIKYFCDRVVILHKGVIVEEGKTINVFNNPQHPYTKKLLAAIPTLDDKGYKNIRLENYEYTTPENADYVKVESDHKYLSFV